MQKLLISILVCGAALLGCSPHKLEIQQGNIITDEMLAKLKTGMNQKQVRYLLGTPQLTDPFHANRWDYLYSLREDGEETERKHLVLFFDGDILSRIEERKD
jgi:outer membrane protein assembly factor BamE